MLDRPLNLDLAGAIEPHTDPIRHSFQSARTRLPSTGVHPIGASISRRSSRRASASPTTSASRNPQLDVYDPKTLAVMDQAFAAIWVITHGPAHGYANDSELRIAVGQKLLNLVADGVTDPIRLRQLTVESLPLPGR
jgi:hypothetical protein